VNAWHGGVWSGRRTTSDSSVAMMEDRSKRVVVVVVPIRIIVVLGGGRRWRDGWGLLEEESGMGEWFIVFFGFVFLVLCVVCDFNDILYYTPNRFIIQNLINVFLEHLLFWCIE